MLLIILHRQIDFFKTEILSANKYINDIKLVDMVGLLLFFRNLIKEVYN